MDIVHGRIASFGYAFCGLATLFRTQRNAQLNLLATIAVLALGLKIEISSMEWCILSLTVVVVWIAEALNTAIEFLADATVPERHPLIKKAKDVAWSSS